MLSIDLGGLKYISGVLKICFKCLRCGDAFKPIPVMMALSTDWIGFYVIFTRPNSIFNLPIASLEFRDRT